MKYLIIAMFLLTSCAVPTVYDKPGTDSDQQRKDFAECRFEVMKATGNSGNTTVRDDEIVSNAIAQSIHEHQIMNACLEAKGYSPQ